jgi:hypothetical protein
MEIYLAPEQATYFVPRFSAEVAHDRVEQKKAGFIAGTVGALLSRPNPADIQLLSTENRLEPFWLISASARTAYDRNRTFTIPAGSAEVQRVTLLGQEVPVEARGKDGPCLTLQGVEHCLDQRQASRAFDGLSGEALEPGKYATFAKTVIVDLEGFAPDGLLVVPPQTRASAVIRQVLADLIKPVQGAQIIHEERVDVETIELCFRPVYAFEFEWSARGKRNVVEFDALTGEMRTGGRKLSTQIKSLVSRDLLFDISADAVGMLVPGGSIAVKLVKAVVDRGKSS